MNFILHITLSALLASVCVSQAGETQVKLGTSNQEAKKDSRRRLRDALAAAPAVKDSFSMQKLKDGTKYFVGMFGPCACATDRLVAMCVKDLAESLKAAVKQSSIDREIECSPLAGCTLGARTVYVECSSIGESLTNF